MKPTYFLLLSSFYLCYGDLSGSSPLAAPSTNSPAPFRVICNENDCSQLHQSKETPKKFKPSLNYSKSPEKQIHSNDKAYSESIFASKMNRRFAFTPIVSSSKNSSKSINGMSISKNDGLPSPKEIYHSMNDQIIFPPKLQVTEFPFKARHNISLHEPNPSMNKLSNELGKKDTHSHIDLDKLEHELEAKDPSSNKDLLLAISILQHHLVPDLESNLENVKLGKKSYLSRNSLNSSISNEPESKLNNSHGEINKTKNNFSYSIEINDLFSPKNGLSEDYFRENQSFEVPNVNASETENTLEEDTEAISQLHWFVLVMDGDCSIIRNRMSTFVMFLKAALSAKLDANYEDIYVPSVFCDKTFMVNITLDIGKYPSAYIRLQSLAEANTTLLEISGEIFYLERILVKKPDSKSNSYLRRHGDVEIVIYIGLGCMGFFILLSLLTAFLVRICRQDEDILMEKRECDERPDYLPRRPKVIYSPTFSQGIDIEKNISKKGEPHSESQGTSVAPSSSSDTLGTYMKRCSARERDNTLTEVHCERKFFIGASSSRLKLLEEVQEEDEEDLVDEYQEHNEDTEVEDTEDIEEMEYEDVDVCDGITDVHLMSSEMDDTCVDSETENQHYSSVNLEDSLRPFYLTSPSIDASANPLNYDNPCYQR